jgi:hypothetical protein
MKFSIVLLFFLFPKMLFSQELYQIPFKNEKYSLMRMSEKEFANKKKHRDLFVYDSLFLEKKQNTLIVHTQIQDLKFTNNSFPGDVAFREYKCVGRFLDVNRFIVKFNQYEFSSYLLIDSKSAAIDTLMSIPTLSPNNKNIASYYFNPWGENLLSQIEFYSLTTNNIKRCFAITITTWVPIDLYWDSNNVIFIKVSSMNDFLNKKDRYDYFKLRLK